MQRRRWLEKAHEVFRMHGPKLGLRVPDLSLISHEEQSLQHARLVANQIGPLLEPGQKPKSHPKSQEVLRSVARKLAFQFSRHYLDLLSQIFMCTMPVRWSGNQLQVYI
jgi:hypothetical protein